MGICGSAWEEVRRARWTSENTIQCPRNWTRSIAWHRLEGHHGSTGRAFVRSNSTPSSGALTGLRVIELADEQAEYCGLALAGLGAEVVKVGATRRQPHAPHRSLLRRPGRSRALPVLLAVQPRQALDHARSAPASRPRPVPRPHRHGRRVAGVHAQGRAGRVGVGCRHAHAAVSHAHCGAHVPFGDHGPWADFKAQTWCTWRWGAS